MVSSGSVVNHRLAADCWSDQRVINALKTIEGAINSMPPNTDIHMSTNMKPPTVKNYILFQVTCTFRFPV